MYRKPIDIRRNHNLTRKPAVGLRIDGVFEHRHFILAGRFQPILPVISDVNVAGGAGQKAAAVGRDARHAMVLRRTHDRVTVRGVHDEFTLVMLNKTNLGHKSSVRPRMPGEQQP